jgi:aliphatic nitrilase
VWLFYTGETEKGILTNEEKLMGDTLPKARVAAVQAAPVFLDREATVEKALSLIGEAARNGADLIAFPEVFVAGYPYWNRMENVFKTTPYFAEMVKNAVEIPSPVTDRLCKAAQRAEAYIVMGINERPTNTLGTLYNTNLILGPTGDILLRHRKLMPTYAEKLVWGFGDGSTLRVLDTPIGKLGTLICGENANPLARFALIAQGEQIHISNYPALPVEGLGYDLCEEIRLRAAVHAFEGKVFTVAVSAVIDGSVVKKVADTEEKRRIMSGAQTGFTGVFGPDSRSCSETLPPGEEGIIYADCDMEAIIGPKLRHDVAGHYNRFDVLSLNLNRSPSKPIFEYEDKERREGAAGREEGGETTEQSSSFDGSSPKDDRK